MILFLFFAKRTEKENGLSGSTSHVKVIETVSKSTQTPLRKRRTCQSSNKSEEFLHGAKRLKVGDDLLPTYKSQTPRKRQLDQLTSNNGDNSMPSSKHLKVSDDVQELSCKDKVISLRYLLTSLIL